MSDRERQPRQRSRGDADGGFLYILEKAEGETFDWRYWWLAQDPPNDQRWKPLYLKARQVFLRSGWSGEGDWFVAPIPFVLDGAVIACKESAGLVYAWSTHELGWLDA